MKKYLLALTICTFLWTIFSTPVQAVLCNGIENNKLVCSCGDAGTVGQCGPSAGCPYTNICSYALSGGYTCGYAANCPPAPVFCDSITSVPECLVSLGGSTFGVEVGTACPSGGSCQPQGGPYVDADSCVCQTSPGPTATPTPNPYVTPTINPQATPTPLPTLPPIQSTGQPCSSLGKNNIYPPNSSCYSEVKDIQANIAQYPLTCISAPEAIYRSTITGLSAPSIVTVDLVSNLSEATLGFLGPDSDTISSVNPDQIAKKYLFNGLFDRPNYSKEEMPRELFRTYWRVLNSQVQANLKAIFLEASHTQSTKLNYYYLDKDLNRQETDTVSLFNELPSCLKRYPVCDDYIKRYSSLSENTKIRYDTLLPFDFDNSRGYLALNGNISKESISYLTAILNGIQGNNGLLNFYTPSSLIRSSAGYITIPSSIESTLYPNIIATDLFSSCIVPDRTTTATAPKTYPVAPSLTQTISIPVQSQLVSSKHSECTCDLANPPCPYSCGHYDDNQDICEILGCIYTPGENTYELTGRSTGRHITVFNNPLVKSLNDIVIGSGQTGESNYYRMMTPSFAPAVEKISISAPVSSVETSNPNVTVNNGSSSVFREDGLAQTAMHLLQNCWLVPGDQQSSSKCGSGSPAIGSCQLSEVPLTGACSKTGFSSFAVGTPYTNSTPTVSPELSAVYAEAEKQTGVSCVILAALHYMEAANDPCRSLISGRKIGEAEPDNGGAVYATLLETAIAAGEEFAGKLSAARANYPGASDFQALVTAFSYYNGGGNANCRSDPPSSLYGHCPALFFGEDDPYPLSWYDQKHSSMYLRCLTDGNCTSSVPFKRPGAYTVALSYYLSLP